MSDLDDLIERYITPQPPPVRPPKVAENPPIVLYRCPQEGYDIYYAPDLGEATYRFDAGTAIDVDYLIAGHVAYYEKSGYWQKI